MEIDKLINEYIDKEKAAKPSPFLQDKIMSKIEAENKPQRISLWQWSGVVASIAIVVASGLMIGGSYSTSNDDTKLTINDSHIENFVILTEYENE